MKIMNFDFSKFCESNKCSECIYKENRVRKECEKQFEEDTNAIVTQVEFKTMMKIVDENFRILSGKK